MLPVVLRMTAQPILVVGGGLVGSRKARIVCESGGRVRVVDPRPQPSVWSHSESLEWVTAEYHSAHLDGVRLVFAAATVDVNRRVVAEARARGLWVNSATEPEDADFDLPAIVRRGTLTIATSTGGVAPSLARRIRERLERDYSEEYATWLQLLAEMRGEVLARIDDAKQRRELLDDFADWPWLELLHREGTVSMRERMREKLEGGRGFPTITS